MITISPAEIGIGLLCLAAGLLLGLAYFASLWIAVRRMTAGRAVSAALLQVARFAGLVGVLVFAALQGPVVLVALALGLVLARPLALGRFRGPA